MQKRFRLTRSISDLDWRFLLLVVSPLSLLVFFFLYTTNFSTPAIQRISSFVPLKSPFAYQMGGRINVSSSSNDSVRYNGNRSETEENRSRRGRWKREVDRSRIAVCLVGGARRFELTGPSIVERVLKEYPNSDLFLNSPMDKNAYKISLLKAAPRVATVRIFEPKPIPETESQVRVLTAAGSPNGIQGLLQYFTLVESCLTMIKAYENQNNFTYDWIVRTRVDGYWSASLDPDSFVPGQYLVPPGSSFGGLNDRFGIGDRATSTVALSRLSLVPKLDSAGFRRLNSETAFKAQLTIHRVPYSTRPQSFCIVTDRTYAFPPTRFGVPVAALSSRGPLNGAKCRPCRPICVGPCVERVMRGLDKGWSWTEPGNQTTKLELCDAHGEWAVGWERIFDKAVGKELTESRKRVGELDVEKCVEEFMELKSRAANWETPPVSEICKLGLDRNHHR